jgi:hypothetical protein
MYWLFRLRSATVTDAIASNRLTGSLQPYARDVTDQDREEHLFALCGLGAGIKRLMDAHPSKWTFGSWESRPDIVLFPSMLVDGIQVLSGVYEQHNHERSISDINCCKQQVL